MKLFQLYPKALAHLTCKSPMVRKFGSLEAWCLSPAGALLHLLKIASVMGPQISQILGRFMGVLPHAGLPGFARHALVLGNPAANAVCTAVSPVARLPRVLFSVLRSLGRHNRPLSYMSYREASQSANQPGALSERR